MNFLRKVFENWQSWKSQFFELAILIQISHNLWGTKVGTKFWWLPWFWKARGYKIMRPPQKSVRFLNDSFSYVGHKKNEAFLEELEGIFILGWNTEFHIFCHNSGCFCRIYQVLLNVACNLWKKEVALDDVTIISTINHNYYSM